MRPVRIGDPLDRSVARARAEEALFGSATPVTLDRYRIIERVGNGGMGVVWSAWDPDLGRPVALKLAAEGDQDTRARAREEGRALAQLSHPNVVPIYDVVDHDAGVLLVMELVRGETLRQVAARRPRTMELVRAYRQAALGLAAAHRAGLVHRDFKPDNAILGADGRVRVLDFGLAHPDGDEPGAIAGTPRYMAPEQHEGVALTAAADQYAFCVALREAVSTGRRPPRWLAPVIARGTAARPADRFPSMDELVRALARDPATRWRRRGVVALAVAAVGGVTAAAVVDRGGAGPVCDGGPAIVEASWGARRAQADAHLGALDTPYAAEARPRILGALDSYASDWARSHQVGCLAHRRGELSDDLFDRRAACLAGRNDALRAVAAVAVATPASSVADLVTAVRDLPAIADCDDAAALTSSVALPAPEQRDDARELASLLAQVEVAADLGDLEAAARQADDLVARANRLGYRPLAARARLARGRIALALDQGDRGRADFASATRDALAVGDEPLAVEAFARRAWTVATTQDPARALDGEELIAALLEHAGPRAAFASALLHKNLGGIALARGDRAGAREEFEAARAGARQVTGRGAIELTGPDLLLVVDDPQQRADLGDELVATYTDLVGDHHPLTLAARVHVGLLRDGVAEARRVLAPACAELAYYHPSMSGLLGECGGELALLAAGAGDLDAVAKAAQLVLDADAHGVAPATVATARAYQRLATGDARGAAQDLAALARAIPAGAPWWEQVRAADLTLAAAAARRSAGDAPTVVTADAARAAALYEQVGAAMPPPVLQRRRELLALLRAAP